MSDEMTQVDPTLHLLTRARDLIADPDSWCTFFQGKDKYGYYIEPWEPETVQRCALGALMTFWPEFKPSMAIFDKATQALVSQIPDDWPHTQRSSQSFILADYNNTHDHNDIIALFDLAIHEVKEGLLEHA